MEARPYDLTKPAELKRLFMELRGYLRISLYDGTDLTGRKYALEALEKLVGQLDKENFSLMKTEHDYKTLIP